VSALEKAARLKKEAFAALDRSKKGTTVRVDYNDLIDVCLAFEEAAKGDYSNLEYSSEINHQRYQGLSKILSRIIDHAVPDCEIWELCFSEYEPEFRVNPDEVARRLGINDLADKEQ
jgi:hypothetical protein